MPLRRHGRRRLVGEHFRSDGQPKRRFESEADARAYIALYGYPKIAYLCSVCQGWHLGSRRGSNN